MIKITEIIPIKFSGRTSFLIEFDYNPVIVATLKSLPNYNYHKKIQAWEIPINCLAQALDYLTVIDDIKLTFLEEPNSKKEEKLTDDEIKNFRVRPFNHQLDAINFGLNHDNWLLLDSMGLGKSLEIMYYAETLKRRGLIDHVLIICGVDSLRQNWKAEIQKFSSYDVRVLGEHINRNGKVQYNTISERVEELKNPIKEFFVVVNAATLRNENIIKVLIDKKNPNQFGLIAVDECHRFGRRSAVQSANLLKLKAKYKIAATGSLLVNTPQSCYIPLSWTENDHSTLTNFKSQYCIFGGFGGHEVIGYKNLEVLKDELESCMIRRTLQDVREDMPKKNLDYELVEMSDEHFKFYDAIKAGVKEEADKIELNASNLLALTTRLRQATSCPSALTTQKIMSSKVERCIELAEDILESGEKVVIMTHFKEPVSVLKDLLKKYNPLIGTGDQSEAETQKNIDEFRNSKNRNLLIGTAQKIGTGFSMPECHYMILLDMPFTFSSLSQTTDRIFRITSDKPVFIKILLCKDTIDERVRDIVEEKQDLSDYLIDGKLSNNLASKLKKVLLEL